MSFVTRKSFKLFITTFYKTCIFVLTPVSSHQMGVILSPVGEPYLAFSAYWHSLFPLHGQFVFFYFKYRHCKWNYNLIYSQLNSHTNFSWCSHVINWLSHQLSHQKIHRLYKLVGLPCVELLGSPSPLFPLLPFPPFGLGLGFSLGLASAGFGLPPGHGLKFSLRGSENNTPLFKITIQILIAVHCIHTHLSLVNN